MAAISAGDRARPAPLGFDWRIGVGILGAFTAREVFVSMMGIVFDINGADEQNQPLRVAPCAKRADGIADDAADGVR